MKNLNNGYGARTSNAVAAKKIPVKIPKKIPKKTVLFGKKKEYIWIPVKFELF